MGPAQSTAAVPLGLGVDLLPAMRDETIQFRDDLDRAIRAFSARSCEMLNDLGFALTRQPAKLFKAERPGAACDLVQNGLRAGQIAFDLIHGRPVPSGQAMGCDQRLAFVQHFDKALANALYAGKFS
eukprot:CAMPEP_0184438924 /NCGR_PEP_ID=MMETSP0738-20130409/682100_1 /TAXON_ID=385413 /ORGANISM="Thalassiosira miniscula, Strain CCMP1093" /LENGTH=126 /DNA_ID=CAMNT_0026806425 /DNA_START=82 /DNA_END=462 /DNA_ORIENTATION=+